jgi:hypothetical protein
MSKRSDDRKPWTSNYPELEQFLKEHECQCQWQLPFGPPSDPRAYVECYTMPHAEANFIVQVWADKSGWDVYTPCRDVKIEATLADLKVRIGHLPPRAETASAP